MRYRFLVETGRLHAALFVVLALPLGIVLIALVPIGAVPDEQAHAARAESLWQGELMGHRDLVITSDGTPGLRAGVIADLSIPKVATAERSPDPNRVTQASLRAARETRWQSPPIFTTIGPIAGYMPLFYVPSAMAIGVARGLGLGPFNAAIAARLANLMGYVLLGAAALLVTRRGHSIMLATLLLPMSLYLAASMNQDGLLIATAALAAALATRAWQAPRTTGIRLAAALLIACIAVVKPPYLALAVLLLPPFPGRGGWRAATPSLLKRFGLVAIIAALCLGWLVWAAHDTTAPFWRSPSEAGVHEPGPLWTGPRPANLLAIDQGAQAALLRAHPSLLFSLPMSALLGDWVRWREVIGVLGALNIILPDDYYWLWVMALAAALLTDLVGPRDASSRTRWLEPLLLLAAGLASVLVIYLSQYIAWTPVGSDRIEGTQGRYLIPLMPLLAVALPRFVVPGATAVRLVGVLVLALAGAVGAYVLPATMVASYYLGP